MVDDSPDNIYLLDLIMQGQNFHTLTATNGIEAVESVKNNSIDLILMDVMMPEMDGFEASSKIRNMKDSAHIPIILITAKKRESEDVIRGLGEGAVEYLTKPFDDEELLARVKAMLRIKHLHDNNKELLAQITQQQYQIEMELKMAESVQRQFLPSEEAANRISGCKIKAHYSAASTIGGDIYDFIDYGDGRIAFMLADVTGHGPAAALIMALVKALIDSENSDRPEPNVLAQRLNAKLLKMIPDTHFITLFFAIADTNKKEITYITAGHPAPCIIAPRLDEPVVLKNNGSLVGIFSEEESFFNKDTLNYETGDKLLFFSDGVYEVRDKNSVMYGLKRIYDSMHLMKNSSVTDIADSLLANVKAYWDGSSELDDIAIVAVEFN